jgi:hypothetical protein
MSLSMTVIARCTLFSSLVMWRVSRTSPCCCCCCFMTAAAWPGQRVAGGTPECCMRERVFKEGGAACAAAVAICAQVLMRVVGLVGRTALRGHNAHCLHWCSRLDDSAINVVSLRLGLVMVATGGGTDWFDCRNNGGHPWNWCLRLHGLCDSSVAIGRGYGRACWCIHPRNSLRVAKMVWSDGFF